MKNRFREDQIKECQDGECIFREGQSSQEMYIVQSGEVQVIKESEKGPIALANVKKGEFLGEMSLLESLPRSASAFAKGNTKLLCIQPGGFLLKIRRDPTFAFELMQALSNRVRSTNEKLLEVLREETISKADIQKVLNEGSR